MRQHRVFLSVVALIFLFRVSTASIVWGRFFIDINPTILGTISLLEVLWILVNLPGSVYSVFNAWDAYKDYMAVNSSSEATKADCVIAWSNVRREVVSAAIQLGYLAIGVIASLAPPPEVPQVATLSSIATLIIFIGGSLILSWCSWRGAADRRALKDAA